MKPRLCVTTIAVLMVAVAAWTQAGDLNPPAGPVAPTHKTLTDVEPRTAINETNTPGDSDSLFKITQSGSYYLTDNITGVTGKHGIEIASSGVKLDLNGFDLAGAAGSLDGVSATSPSLTNIVVANGSVRFWGDQGVDLGTVSASNCRVAEVLAGSNTGTGILAGPTGAVSGCLAYGNGAIGISAGYNSIITNSSASFNIGNGIVIAVGCRVSQCNAYDNEGSGISIGNGSTVIDSSARANTLDGILCSAACMIRGNSCSINGNLAGNGAGIRATGGDNRIEGNNSTGADRGIEISGAGNMIYNNSCSGNASNWEIAAGNFYGEIVDLTSSGTPAVSGNSAPSALGTVEPNANFSY